MTQMIRIEDSFLPPAPAWAICRCRFCRGPAISGALTAEQLDEIKSKLVVRNSPKWMCEAFASFRQLGETNKEFGRKNWTYIVDWDKEAICLYDFNKADERTWVRNLQEYDALIAKELDDINNRTDGFDAKVDSIFTVPF